MVTDIVQAAISIFDGLEFTGLPACPACGGPVRGYDTRRKKFAVIVDREGEHVITVRIRRFTCRICQVLCYADEPFYPDTRIGSPVIDLFFTLSSAMPPRRAARIIDAMGIRVDRTTWRNYTGRNFGAIPAADVYGMRLPFSVLALSSLAARAGEGSRIVGAEVLNACGFPSARRAPLHLPLTEKEGDERDKEDKKEDRQVQEPQKERDD
jgi:hypothetical protein